MKFPKNRAHTYVVVREDGDKHTAILGVFSDVVEADNYKDACASEWFDRRLAAETFFEVRLSTYYG